MKNHLIHATRVANGAVSAPEYAIYHLQVNVTFAKGLTEVRELSVRFYSFNYLFKGTDTRRVVSGRAVRNWHFNVASSEYWKAGHYWVFVYADGVPRWFSGVYLFENEEFTACDRLMCLEPDSVEMFFAGQVAFRPWWQAMEQFRFGEPFVVRFLEQLSHLKQCLKQKSSAGCLPSVRVEGDVNEAERFASEVLDPLIEEDLKLSCILTEVNGTDGDMLSLHLLERVCYLVKNQAASDTLFVFYGDNDTMNWLNQNCTAFSSLFDSDSVCISLPMGGNQSNDVVPFLPETEEPSVSDEEEEAEANEKTALQRLDDLTGLAGVKHAVHEARLMALFTQRRKELGLDVSGENRNHILFFGNPGTGKTTVARLIGEIYHEMGLLSRGHTVETERAKLVGEYIGQTEQRTNAAIEAARGGVLFIDEAYTLVHKDDSRDFGKEAINALLTVLAEPNPDMIVILAGYENKMQDLFQFNPGLKDRFPLQFRFEDYTADELLEMAHRLLTERNFELTEAAAYRLEALVQEAVAHKDEHFGNGRWIHNLVEHGILKRMARRVMSQPFRDDDAGLFCRIEEADILGVEQDFLQKVLPKANVPRRIGFIA